MEFKAGDVVRLKSGGPLMTIRTIGTDGRVHCSWFNRAGDVFTHERQDFEAAMLVSVNS